MDKRRIILMTAPVLLVLILSIFAYPTYSQNNTGNESVTVTDTVDDDEDLFDENTNYKEMYKDLNKDGDWLQVKESDLDDDSGDTDGQEVSTTVTNVRIINVWRPRGMSSDWNPYSEGRWVYTYSGWVWVSDYDWGWAAYHYGRWYYDLIYGWVWLPGRYWAPCWVQWCYTPQYIGWYPIYPRRHGWHHRGHYGHHDRFYHNGRHNHWVIVHRNKFTEKIDKKVIIDPSENKNIIEGSKKIAVVKYDGSSFVNVGPKVNVIEKNTGQKIQPKEINSGSKGKTKIDENSVSIYRNDVTKKENTIIKKKNDTGINNNDKKNKNNNTKENSKKNNEISKEKAPYKNEGTKERNPKNNDENRNKEVKKEKAPDIKKENTNRDTQTKRETKTYEGKKESSRKESNTYRDSGSKNRESYNGNRNKESNRSNESSRSKGNNESKSNKK